jgi:zinc transport system substrate-binding protein
MKETLHIILFSALILIVACGCQKQIKTVPGKPLIITTIHPYELILQELADTLFYVENIIPANASPHTWSPTPQDVFHLQKADLVVSNGLGLDKNLEQYLKLLGNKNIFVSDFMDRKQLITETNVSSTPADTLHQLTTKEVNPHIWTSPDYLKAIIIGLRDELSKRYPEYTKHFTDKTMTMLEEIDGIDATIRAELKQFKRPSVVSLHDAFVYFFRYYHIDFVGSVQPDGVKEPTPRQLKELADKIRSRHIKAILIEPRISSKPAETLARELNLGLIPYDDLGTTLGAAKISDFLRLNWQAIKQGLSE